MSPAAGKIPALSEDNAAFVRQGVSVIVGARDARNLPTLVRAIGCRVAPDRSRVTVFVVASQCAELLANVRANGAIAVVFSQPSTHRTIQLKAMDAAVTPLQAGDRKRMAVQNAALVDEIAGLGYPPEVIRTFLAYDPADVAAVTFKPSSAFAQTPGPNAGERLTS